MQPLRPTQSIDNNNSSNSSQQYVKPFSMDERALPASQRQILEQLVRQLSKLTSQSPDDIWNMVKEHLGLSRNMSLSIQHYSMAEFFLQQRIQVANQGGNHSLLEQIMNKLNQGNNREMVLNFMRMTFGHSALSLLNEDELKQVLAQLPNLKSSPTALQPSGTEQSGTQAANSQTPNSNNAANAATPPLPNSPALQTPNSATPTPLSYAEQPLPSGQQQIIQQLLDNLSQQLKQPIALIQQQLSQILKHSADQPLQNQHFTTARDFLQMRLIATAEPLQPLNNVLNMMQPLTKQESQFIQQFAEQRFQALPVTIINSEQIDELIIELFTRRASGKSAWQVEGVIQPIFSDLIPFFQQLIDKPIFIPTLFAIVMFLIFLLMI